MARHRVALAAEEEEKREEELAHARQELAIEEVSSTDEDEPDELDKELSQLEDQVQSAEVVESKERADETHDTLARMQRDFDKGGRVAKLKRELRAKRAEREATQERVRKDPELGIRPAKVRRFYDKKTLHGGHHKAVYWAEYSADGSMIASCSHDCSVAVWDAKTMTLKRNFRGSSNSAHLGWVLQCAFSPDGKQLLSCSEDKTMRLWWVESGRLVHTFEHHKGCVMGCAWSPNGMRAVSCSKDRAIVVWNVSKAVTRSGKADAGIAFAIPGAPASDDGHSGTVFRAIFSPDARFLLSCSQDKTIRLWDVAQEGKLRRVFQGHKDSVLGIDFHKSGHRFASCSHDKTVRIWNTRSGTCERELCGHTSIVYDIRFSPEERGARLLSCGHDGQLIVWDARHGKDLNMIDTEHQSWVLCCNWAPDGRRAITASGDHTVKVWAPLPPLTGWRHLVYDSRQVRRMAKFISRTWRCIRRVALG